ncbi:MAG: hypothetical protein LBQ33_06500 [Oscillospiraceae bacterium]|nr:hypothetical protein [Oscillospiraceae bacterium]
MLIKCKNSANFRRLVAELLVEFGKDARFGQINAYADMHPETIL